MKEVISKCLWIFLRHVKFKLDVLSESIDAWIKQGGGKECSLYTYTHASKFPGILAILLYRRSPFTSRDIESLLFESVNFDLFPDIAYLFRCQVSLIGENATRKFSNFWVSYRFINRKWGILELFFLILIHAPRQNTSWLTTYFCEKMRFFFSEFLTSFGVFKTFEL